MRLINVYIICFFLTSMLSSQELVPFLHDDIYSQPFRSTYIKSYIKGGMTEDFGYRKFQNPGQHYFIHADNSLHFFRGKPTGYSGLKLGYKLTHFIDGPTKSESSINWRHEFNLSAYLGNKKVLNGAYTIHSTPLGNISDYSLKYLFRFLGRGGIQYTQAIDSEMGTESGYKLLQIGYRYKILQDNKGNEVKIGWTAAKNWEDDSGLYYRLEASIEQNLPILPSVTLNISVANGPTPTMIIGEEDPVISLSLFMNLYVLRHLWIHENI